MISVLIEDTRNPVSKHRNIHDYCAANGIEIVRNSLEVGDYTLPTDRRICIDTKNGLQEACGNMIGKDHERFRRECEKAQKLGVQLVVLVEEECVRSLADVARWQNPRRNRWFMVYNAHKAGKMKNVRIPKAPPPPSETLAKAMQTMEDKYGIKWEFCDKALTGSTIVSLLSAVDSACKPPNHA